MSKTEEQIMDENYERMQELESDARAIWETIDDFKQSNSGMVWSEEAVNEIELHKAALKEIRNYYEDLQERLYDC